MRVLLSSRGALYNVFVVSVDYCAKYRKQNTKKSRGSPRTVNNSLIHVIPPKPLAHLYA